METNKTSALKINKRNFDKFVTLSKQSETNVYWWKSNFMGSFDPVIRPNPTIVLNTDASFLAGWAASMAGSKTRGLFSSEESQQHLNILELKTVEIFGLKALCNNFHDIHILIQIDNMSAVAAINKMARTSSIDIDQVVHLIWNFILKHDNWVTATHIPGMATAS